MKGDASIWGEMRRHWRAKLPRALDRVASPVSGHPCYDRTIVIQSTSESSP
jgi:hypothetical protein